MTPHHRMRRRRQVGLSLPWLSAGISLAVGVFGALALLGPPQQSVRIDRAKLDLAAAEAADNPHGLAARVGRLRAQADETPITRRALEQVRTIAHPPQAHPDPPLEWPLRGAIVSGYGLRAWPDFGSVHPGLDLVNLPGTKVRAAGDGIVVSARHDPSYGNTVVLDHGEQPHHPGRWSTIYAHLGELAVVDGQELRAGDVLGTLGNTGALTTGPHLHFEVRIAGQPVDPRRWLP
jgi:murein DD-endopeptidase MepM/ murein hydrolase activator NlpD